jgi:LacI family transcriptional regulator
MVKQLREILKITRQNSSARLEDVAHHAGVSTATVSRVLNQPDLVRRTLRDRVEASINDLGYVAHGAARALASRRSRIIGAIVPTIDNAIFSSSIQSLQKRASEFGYTLLLASSDYSLDREKKECQALLEQNIDGLILVGEEHDPAVFSMLKSKQVPYVNIWCYNEDSEHPNIGFDNYLAAKQITQYLLDLGHRQIAMIAGVVTENDRASARLNAVMDTLNDAGLAAENDSILQRDYQVSSGRDAAKQLLKLDKQPTAIICGNDVLALGALFECQAQGLKVPSDISIVGYDGLEIAAQVTPALTTVVIPSIQMGVLAAEFLISTINKKPIQSKIKLEAELAIRETTSKPPRTN